MTAMTSVNATAASNALRGFFNGEVKTAQAAPMDPAAMIAMMAKTLNMTPQQFIQVLSDIFSPQAGNPATTAPPVSDQQQPTPTTSGSGVDPGPGTGDPLQPVPVSQGVTQAQSEWVDGGIARFNKTGEALKFAHSPAQKTMYMERYMEGMNAPKDPMFNPGFRNLNGPGMHDSRAHWLTHSDAAHSNRYETANKDEQEKYNLEADFFLAGQDAVKVQQAPPVTAGTPPVGAEPQIAV